MVQSSITTHLTRFTGQRVLVIGDVYLDASHFGRITGTSLEAPIQVFEEHRVQYNPGAAGNVAANLSALGAHTSILGVIGSDANAETLKAEFDARSINRDGLVADPSHPTNTYGKFRAGGDTYPEQEILRSDTPHRGPIPADVESELIEFITSRASGIDAIVVIDQVSSCITPDILSAVIRAAAEYKLLTVADSRERIHLFRDFDLVVPNEHELGVGLNMPVDTDENIANAAQVLLKQNRNAFITRGPDGISVFLPDNHTLVPTHANTVIDVTGAGDTVTAASTLALLAGAPHTDAAAIANAAATIAVAQLGAVSVSLLELEAALAQPDRLVNVHDLNELRGIIAIYQKEGKKVVWTNGCFDILHAGHVTYLLQAAREGDILVVGLNSDASVSAIKGPDRPIVPQDERALIIAALGCVDHVIVFEDNDTVPLLEALKPDIYAKGGDYTLDTINQDERKLVEGYGGRIALIPGVDGRSTTNIIQRISG
jgi:D-beta-D-heptose 7-phosphate kinase / D-beta-D-heptose 1-phosphate adenosyltransferase